MNIKTKWFVFLPLSFIPTAYAEVIVDGSLGGGNQVVVGPNYDINEGLGVRQGANLFHSFSQFNINTGEVANFTTNAQTQNILARVTGGQSSLIDGKIVSNSSANLWLMNPGGWVIGSNASFNVNGAFHLSSAHGIGFANGELFFADPTSQSVLSVAEPIDYQFKAGQQANITFDHATLVMQDGKDISVVGGDIHMKNSFISAPGGRVLLASNAGQGRWRMDGSGLTQLSGVGGIINIEHDIKRDAVGLNAIDSDKQASIFKPSLASSSDEREISAGLIQLSAHEINLKNALIVSQAWDNTNAKPTILQADNIHFNSSAINNNVNGSKNAGGVEIYADNLVMENISEISSNTKLGTTGFGGNIFLDLQNSLTLLDTSGINSNVGGNKGGDINVKADNISINDFSVLRVATNSDGDAGNLTINTHYLGLANGATLDTATTGLDVPENKIAGNGGKLIINAEQIALNQKGLISSSSFAEGNAGNIDITTNNLSLTDGSNIEAKSEGVGSTGAISLGVKGIMKVQQDSKINTSALKTNGGNISINSQGLAVQQSQIVTSAGEQGNGGDISINTDTLIMSGGFIQANTAAADASGGNIQVNATTTLATQEGILVGDNERQQFSPNSSLNVIQAAAPDGVSGQVNVSTVELNIAGQLAKIDSSLVANKTIANDPCNVARDEEMSSLIETGHGGLPVKASDSINLPLHRHLPKDSLQPQSKLHSVDKTLAFLSAHDDCQQELN